MASGERSNPEGLRGLQSKAGGHVPNERPRAEPLLGARALGAIFRPIVPAGGGTSLRAAVLDGANGAHRNPPALAFPASASVKPGAERDVGREVAGHPVGTDRQGAGIGAELAKLPEATGNRERAKVGASLDHAAMVARSAPRGGSSFRSDRRRNLGTSVALSGPPQPAPPRQWWTAAPGSSGSFSVER